MIKVLIVDDEAPARIRIRAFLEARQECLEIAEAANGPQALELIRTFRPRIVFLDVNMPQVNGFEVLQQVSGSGFQVIFQTAHDQFALQAFEVNACDFLLKPFHEARFNQAFERAVARADVSDFKGILSYLPAQKRFLNRLVVKAGVKSKLIEVKDIQFFESIQHVTELHLESSLSFAVEPSLNELERQLDPEQFIRVHRNAIVRLDAVREFQTQPVFEVTLSGARSFKVARDRQRRVSDALKAR